MLTIRLTRKGKKNQPFFKVVVIDKRRSSKGGRAVEDLGYVDPLKKRKNFKKERILYWISKGAKPSPTIHNFLVSEKIIDAKKINLFKKSKKPIPAETSGVAKPAETPVTPAVAQTSAAVIPEVKPTPEVKTTEPEKPTEIPKDLPAQTGENKTA
jgi:small subunit ribosomal protein S16